MLSPGQVADYRRHGYVVAPGLLSEAEVDRFLAHEALPHPERDGGDVLQRHRGDALWAELARHPNIAGSVAQLIRGLPMIVQTMYLRKDPGGVGIPLHQDTHYLPNDPNTLMACWVALTDTGPDNGGFTVAPGTHEGPLLSAHRHEDLGEFSVLEEVRTMRDRDGREWTEEMYRFQVDIPREDTLELTIPRGAGVFFHGMLAHGSYANRSADAPRLAFAVHYVREGSWLFRSDVQNPVPTR